MLQNESTHPWHEVKTDFVDSEYHEVHDRQMKELEIEDDLLSKVPVSRRRHQVRVSGHFVLIHGLSQYHPETSGQNFIRNRMSLYGNSAYECGGTAMHACMCAGPLIR